MVYNLNWTNNSQDLYNMTLEVNNASGGVMASMLLATIFIIVMIVFLKRETDIITGLFFSSFITSIFTFFFYGAGMVGEAILFPPMVVALGTLLILIFK